MKKKHDYSQLNILYHGYYTWRNPLHNISQFFRNIKWAYQRVTRGWAEPDVWSMSYHLQELIPSMLNYLIDEMEDPNCCCGYPGIGEADTPEKWTAILKEMRDHFLNSREYNEDDYQKKEDLLFDEMEKHITKVNSIEHYDEKFGKLYHIEHVYDDKVLYERCRRKWWKTCQSNAKYRQKELYNALDLLKKWFYSLGD